MIDTKLLQTLSAVITEQSFDKAAQTLFVTQSAVSQRIRQLEEHVGQMLVIRTIPVVPTSAGMAMLRHYRQLTVMEQALFEELGSGETVERETVTLAVNADSLDTWFLNGIQEILHAENVLLDLVVDDQSVTHAYLRSGEVQGAITSTPASFQGLVTHELGDMEYYCVATPAFRDLYFPHGLSGEGASHAPVVIFNHKDALQHEFLKQRLGQEIAPPMHVMPSNISFQGIILAGWAYGMISSILAAPHLHCGALIDLTPGETLRVPLFYQGWSRQSRLSRCVADAVVRTARAWLTPRANYPDCSNPDLKTAGPEPNAPPRSL